MSSSSSTCAQDCDCAAFKKQRTAASNDQSAAASSLDDDEDQEQQVFVRNMGGRSVSIHINLNDDVSSLCEAFALKEGIPKERLYERAAFIFGGRQLGPGTSLRGYGIRKGSNIHLSCRLRSQREGDVPISVIIHTPYAKVKGTLVVHAASSISHHVSVNAKVFRKSHRTSDGVCMVDQSNRKWYLTFRDWDSVESATRADIWERFDNSAMMLSRIQVSLKDASDSRDGRKMRALTDTAGITLYDILAFDGILLLWFLTQMEQVVDDTTHIYLADDTIEEDCCICLEALAGQMLRRLPCMHHLHADCAMRCLSKSPRCPLCRHSLQPRNLAVSFSEDEEDSDATPMDGESEEDQDEEM